MFQFEQDLSQKLTAQPLYTAKYNSLHNSGLGTTQRGHQQTTEGTFRV